MGKAKRTLSVIMAALMLVFTCMTYVPANAAVTLPKVSFVGLENIPAAVGEEQTLMLTSKNYTGDVQYQVFYVQRNDPSKKTTAAWSMLNDWTPVADSTVPVEVKVPAGTITVAGNYSFAIRVRRANSIGAYSNSYGNYDDAYPFNYVFASAATAGLKSATIDKHQIAVGEKFTVSGLTAGNSYKLFTFNEARAQKWDKDPVATTTTADKLEFAPTEAGNYVLDVQLRDANDKVTAVKLFNVKVAGKLEVNSVDSITAALNNPISTTYNDMVLDGTPAQILAKAVDADGKPVANVPILFTIPRYFGEGTPKFIEPVAYTNANGIAIGFIDSQETIDGNPLTVEYRAEVVGKSVKPVDGKMRFAQLSVGTVSVTNPVKDYDEDGTDEVYLNPGRNADLADDILLNDLAYHFPRTTANMNGVATEYVASEKVSATGTSTNAVTFEVSPSMNYLVDDTNDAVDVYSKTIGWKSGAYHPYDSVESDKIEIPSGLKYATMYFKNLQIDEHAQMIVHFYTSADKELEAQACTLYGSVNDSSRAIQIPSDVLNSVSYAIVELKAAGQVNTALNGGVELDKVEGVFKSDALQKTKSITIPNAKINWTATSAVYSQTVTLKDATARTFAGFYNMNTTNLAKVDYKVPVFPYTGNAVVTEYDINNKILQYYFIPTTNVTNTNVLTNMPAILASKNEINDAVGTITPNADGTEVTVNSEKVGTTLLKGVIDIPGVSKEVLNATNATVYTSVNWAPLPNSTTSSTSNLFALLGQKVNVVAQLVDKNGNPATESGQTVTIDGVSTLGVTGSTTQTTDVNGQVKWTLTSAREAYAADVSASNANYDVKLKIGDVEVDEADLYWISAQLTYKPELDENDPLTATTIGDYKANYKVGNAVEFGFQAKGHVIAGAPVTGVKVYNLPVDFNKVSGTTGSVAKVDGKPYCFLAKSDAAGLEKVDAKIGTVTDKVTVSFTTDGTNYSSGTFVGTGSTSLYNKFTMPIQWETDGVQFNFVVPQGNVIAVGNTAHVYVKLTDAKGNVLANQAVQFDVTTTAKTTTVVNTNANGVAKVDVFGAVEGQATVQATYNGETQYYSLNFVPSTKTFGLVSAGVNNSGTNDVITLSFSNDINPNSVVARLFTIRAGATVYAVKSYEVAGNQVKLTLADSNAHLYNTVATTYTVDYAPFAEYTGDNAGIEFNLTDVDGNALNGAFDTITFVTPANVSVKSVGTIVGGSLDVSFFNAPNMVVYLVDSNGHIYSALTDGNGDATIVGIGAADAYTLYCNGVSYSF